MKNYIRVFYFNISTVNIIAGKVPSVEALINLFYKEEELARLEKQKTDAIFDEKTDSMEKKEAVSTTAKPQEGLDEETCLKCSSFIYFVIVHEFRINLVLFFSIAKSWAKHGTHLHWCVRRTPSRILNYR